jgi:hypothetical protein
VRFVALGAALAGGVCLVAHLFVGPDPLAWVGLALLGVAVAVVGGSLVRQPWLVLVTAAGSVGLAWASLEALRAVAPDRELEGVVGGLATLCVAVAMLRPAAEPSRREEGADRPGNHRH